MLQLQLQLPNLSTRRGAVSPPLLLAVGSLVLLLLAAGLIYVLAASQRTRDGGGEHLLVYCAAGIRQPLDELAEQYRRDHGVEVTFVPGNSGSLLGQIELRGEGDLYIPADASFVATGREKGLLAESMPLATMRLVVAVAQGNPKGIAGIRDLLRDDVDFMLAEPRAGVGLATRQALETMGLRDRFDAAKRSQKATVNEVALDVSSGAVDAGLVWDSTARQYGLTIAEVPELSGTSTQTVTVPVAVLTASRQPTAALRFARFISSPQFGNPVFKASHFEPVPGDTWTEVPELTLFSGTVSRPAIVDTLAAFEKRHGVRITTAYHGCGTLVGMMKTGHQPDAYLACDISYTPPAGLDFEEPVVVSTMDLVIVVPADNPHGINGLADLARPGLRIGLADPVTTALGGVTRTLLQEAGVYEKALDNLKTQNGRRPAGRTDDRRHHA